MIKEILSRQDTRREFFAAGLLLILALGIGLAGRTPRPAEALPWSHDRAQNTANSEHWKAVLLRLEVNPQDGIAVAVVRLHSLRSVTAQPHIADATLTGFQPDGGVWSDFSAKRTLFQFAGAARQQESISLGAGDGAAILRFRSAAPPVGRQQPHVATGFNLELSVDGDSIQFSEVVPEFVSPAPGDPSRLVFGR